MKVLFASLLAIACAAPSFAAGDPSPACAAKRTRIESEITEARSNGNRHKIAGLKSALAANKLHCTDASLEAERQRDISSATTKVARREADLAAAQVKGDPKKIAKQQGQLDAARQALSEAQKPLPQ